VDTLHTSRMTSILSQEFDPSSRPTWTCGCSEEPATAPTHAGNGPGCWTFARIISEGSNLRQGEASGCHHLSRHRIKLLNEVPPVFADTHVKRPSEIPRKLVILGFEGHSWRVKTLLHLSGCLE
jgi:hypothetical protein